MIKKTGSVLVFSLIILSLVMVIALGMASVAIKENRMASSTNLSTQSLQVADSGAEIVLNKLKSAAPGQKISDIYGLNCSGSGEVVGNIGSGSVRTYTVTFADNNGNNLNCDALVSEISEIKSAGEYREITRAISVPVK